MKDRLSKHSTPEPNTGCVLWCSATNKPDGRGYGVIRIDGRLHYAHRLAWELDNGPIPDGKVIGHKCDVPLCINPAHLFLGEQAANMADMVAKRRQSRGTHRPLAKLTEDDVRAIRASNDTLAIVAERYGISLANAQRVRTGQTWKHVEAA